MFLWTRRPSTVGSQIRLRAEIAEDAAFDRVIARTGTKALAASDWTCRVLVGNLQPARVYWYRFIDSEGNASRTGRTITAPADDDARPVRFAFASCQNINVGAQHAYRRMIFEDERAPESKRLDFVLHLGDFIYEGVAYPEDNPRGLWSRSIRQVVRLPHGEKVAAARGFLHVPTSLEDYRTLYRAYLEDPDIQDARARWPFVCMWDNHEFSGAGWQSIQTFGGEDRPRQLCRVAAMQAWFEYQPARIVKSSGAALDAFDPPVVRDAPIERFDDHGLGIEPNNRAALASLTGYRNLRWGRHLDLILTDQHSYRSKDPARRPEANVFRSPDFPEVFPQEAMEVLDAGRTYAGGRPPETIRFGAAEVRNFRKDEPPATILGAEQKVWFLKRLKESRATWKVWGCSLGTLEYRTDLHNLPVGITRAWPSADYAICANRDHSTSYVERAEIYAHVREEKITGFATVCGDRHSFWAGLAAPSLPPKPFEPVGVAFVTGSISMPSLAETLETSLAPDHALRGYYLGEAAADGTRKPVINLLFRHGVRSSFDYQRTGDIQSARRLSNAEMSPHLSFLDIGGNGYSTVQLSSDSLECEFVCIPRPITHEARADGGPVSYRVVHRTPLWKAGERPKLEQYIVEGDPALSL